MDQFWISIKGIHPGVVNPEDSNSFGCQAVRLNNSPTMPTKLNMTITCQPWPPQQCDVGFWPEGKDLLPMREFVVSERGNDASITCPRGHKMVLCGLVAIVLSFDDININVPSNGEA